MSDFPITITAEAADQLRKLIARKGEAGAFVRVGVKGGGCSGFEYVLKIDTREIDGDAVLLLDELKVVCDPKSAEFLLGATLSLSGNLIGGGFTFENPNAQRSCGCGTSFTPRKTA
ncbi:MAG: iron-sulfur cluster assembly accessory protein [Fimbriimonadaceae bacterium]|nr:iron-sulfur cluster assembly accessory protein [Fimbriimonadaceae bacterium]